MTGPLLDLQLVASFPRGIQRRLAFALIDAEEALAARVAAGLTSSVGQSEKVASLVAWEDTHTFRKALDGLLDATAPEVNR
jgi:hypothetical protein